MADPTPPGERALRDAVVGIRKRLDRLESPSGTQRANVVAELRSIVDGLEERVDDFITNQSYTRTVIDQKLTDERTYTDDRVAHPVNIEASGFVIVQGNADVRGVITSLGTRNNPISTFRTVVQDDAGNMGYSSSARATKTDIETATFDEAAFRTQMMRRFRYIADVAARGDEARVDLGVIADELVDNGFKEPVFFDAEGEPEGVNYDRLTPILWMAVQKLMDDRDEMSGRLTALEERSA